MLTIFLPWFQADLSPNARVHRLKKAKIARQYRSDCRLLAIAASKGCKAPRSDTALWITFCPPTHHHRDLDNCLAAIKSGLDGVADGLRMNDRRFRPLTIDFGDVVYGGQIIVRVDTD